MKAYLSRLLICCRWQFQPKGIRKSCWRQFELCWEAFAYLIVGAVGLPLAILAFVLLPLRMLGTCFYAAFKYSDTAVNRLKMAQAKATA